MVSLLSEVWTLVPGTLLVDMLNGLPGPTDTGKTTFLSLFDIPLLVHS